MTDTMYQTQQQTTETPAQGTWPVNTGGQAYAGDAYPTDVPRWPPAPPANVPPIDTQPGTGGANPHSHRLRRVAMAAIVAAIMAGGGVAGGIIGSRLDDSSSTATTATTATAASNSTSAGTISSVADVVSKVSPSIVTITVQTSQGTAEGSGVILSADGKILTNNHVIEDAVNGGGTISVQFSDGKTASASLIGRNANADLAVIQAAGVSGLTAATLGDSSSLQVGQTVLAFGSPLGLQGTVTEGIVSALNRSISSQTESLSGLIQTDAAINPGNSGGALVDTAGRIVGINVAIATTGQDSGNIGVGFSIPINTAKQIANQIINGTN